MTFCTMNLHEAVERRILILDGAMGTMIQGYGLSEADFRGGRFAGIGIEVKGNNDLLNITRPDVIADIHRKYLEAGADIITTNTFSSQRVSQADYGLEDVSREMALRGAEIARKAADCYSADGRKRFVAGSVGPTNKACSISPDVGNPALRDITFDELYAAYREQVGALIEGGVDAVLIETIFDTLNAKAAVCASVDAMREAGVSLPVMLSATVSDLAGRTLSGQTLDAFLASMGSYPIFSVGLNCSFGAAQMKPFLRQLAQKAPCYVSVYPNAGLPNEMGLYDETPEHMAAEMQAFVDEGLANIVGGCCGTTDAYIRLFAKMAEGRPPRKPSAQCDSLRLSGLDVLELTSAVRFVNIGERCNVAGSRKFLRLINEKKYGEALAIARKQVADGALMLDINMDDGLLDAPAEMVNFINLLMSEPDVARVPLMIDSSDWNVILAGLKCVQGKCVVNSISLKEGEQAFLSKARDVLRFGAAVVVMCFDEEGQATTFERRTAIAARAYRLLTHEVGMPPQDIIIDPNVLAIATGIEEHDGYAADFIKATAWIRRNLPGAHVSGGVSNLSFAFRGNNYIREAMHAVFLYHAIQNGMDFGIVNPATKVAYDDIPADQLRVVEAAVLCSHQDAGADLAALAERLKAESEGMGCANGPQAETEPSWHTGTVGSRLAAAMVKGVGDYIEEDLQEALREYPSAADIIEGPLMEGMDKVGELFGCGKMFLPQVVKSARTMKQAVGILQPHLEAAKGASGLHAGKALLATVKGDVHDIGKNIAAVVMACNNYDIIDMGVMVPADQIVRKAQDEQVDIIGLSGLITPSLAEMVNVVRQLDAAGVSVPVMIGGAATSELYVALKIAPEYRGPVVWLKDASQNSIVAARLLNPATRDGFAAELDSKYGAMRKAYRESKAELTPIGKARDNRLDLFGE